MLEGVSKRSYIGSSSGTYNVRRNELAKQVSGSAVAHTVHFLDGTQHVFMVEKKSKGQMLLDQVFQHLDLLEKDYFSLQFSALENGVNVMRWLDPRKSLRRQCPGVRASQQPVEFHLAVKFYATDVSKLQEEYTRYLFCQQLRSDVQRGHLPLQPTAACVLASYAAQADLGDYSVDEHPHGYLSRVRWMPQLTEELQAKVTELHASHRGLTPCDAEYAYIEHAQRLEMYGVERHPARDCGGRDIQLGVSSCGLLVFHNAIKINTFSWAKIVKIVFKRKEFFIQLRREAPEEYDSLLGFRLGSHRASKCLWRSAVEHHTFFRLLAPQPPVRRRLLGGLMASGSRFRFSGRTELQALHDGRRAVAAAAGDGRLQRSFARLNGSCGDSSALLRDASHRSLPACDGTTRPPATPAAVAGGQLQPVTHTTSSVGLQRRVMATDNSQPTPRLAWTEHDKDGDSGFLERVPAASTVVVGPGALLRAPSCDKQRPLSASSDVQAAPPAASGYPEPRRYGLLMLDSSSPVSTASSDSPFAPSDLSAAPFMDDSEGSDRSLPERPDQLGPRSPDSPEPSVASHGLSEVGSAASTTSSLVLVLLRPDQQGRYGFNVKGGADFNSPVTVSKVAPTSGGRLSHRLSEGDQLVLINGVDISSYSHDAVVDLIKSSRDQHSELILTVRPNVNYEGGEDVEEPLVQYVPDQTPRTSLTAGDADSPLAQSLLLLSEALASGAARREFDKLQRRAPELTMDDSLLQNNINKNRYRDISPYDSTRVLLLKAQSGDYINANHVTMEIPGSGGIVNRYIAAQGPLRETVDDFWTMVWEQRSSLLVMLTTLIEQGRVKCHRYWPENGKSSYHQLAEGQQLRVSCQDEKLGDSFRYRNLRILCVETGEERHVMHVQYMSWPDHGVPADCGDFVQFVERVREARRLRPSGEPVVVHCSAGIGRTGVLILMETALCLMDAAQPVYPLHLVLAMRQQRAMMVQTAVQYEFVCEAIQRVYETGHGVAQMSSPAPAGGRQSPEASSEVTCPPAAEDGHQQSSAVVAETAGDGADVLSVDSTAGDDEEVEWRGLNSRRSLSPDDCVSLSSESPAHGGNSAPVPVFAYSV